VAVVPVFGVAATLVPVSASAANRTATVTASAMIAGAPTRANMPPSPAAPSAASSNFWTYETIKRDSQISQDDNYDFSAKMTHELEKVTRKALADKITSVGKWLRAVVKVCSDVL